jgi:hypothetical protein
MFLAFVKEVLLCPGPGVPSYMWQTFKVFLPLALGPKVRGHRERGGGREGGESVYTCG